MILLEVCSKKDSSCKDLPFFERQKILSGFLPGEYDVTARRCLFLKEKSEISCQYLDKKTRKASIVTFQQNVQEFLNSILEFCNPCINYEKLFCSLIVFTNCMKGILYTTIKEQMRGKIKEYSHLKLTKPEHMIGVIEANIEEEYKYSTNTSITVLDLTNKCSKEFKLNGEQVIEVNKLHSFFQGNYLTNIINE